MPNTELREKLDFVTEHADEENTDRAQAKYPGAKNESYSDHIEEKVLNFKERLNDINDAAAAAFDNRDPLANYTAEDRTKFLNSYVEAFNQVDFNNDMDAQYRAAKDIAHTVFQPAHELVHMSEFRSQYAGDPKILDILEESDVEYVRKDVDASGRETGAFTVQVTSMEHAQRIINDSEGMAHIVASLSVDQCEHNFANALAASHRDQEAAVEAMSTAYEKAMAWANGDITSDWTNMDDRTDFMNRIAEFKEERLDSLVDNILDKNWSKSTEHINHMEDANDPDATGAKQAQNAIVGLYFDGMKNSVNEENLDHFEAALNTSTSHDEQFKEAIQDQTGFVNSENYQQPDLPEEFTSLEQVQDYLNNVQEAIKDATFHNERMSGIYGLAIRDMTDKCHILEQVIETRANEDCREEYDRLHKLAQGMNYLLQPVTERNQEAARGLEPATA